MEEVKEVEEGWAEEVEEVVEHSRRTIEIFCSYARKDKALHDEMVKHLDALKRSELITIWHDQEIAPGAEWEKQIDKHLRRADIILLLLSPDFIHSDYCYGREMQIALERHNAGKAHVIPILLRPVHWEETPLRKLQVLPPGTQPITAWKDIDAAFYHVVNEIGKVAKTLKAQRERAYWISKGKQDTEAGEYDKAELAYATVLKLFPEHPDNEPIYRSRADLLRRLARYQDALEMYQEMYQKAVASNAVDSHLYQALGDVLAKLSRKEEALDAYNQALSLDPQNIRLLEMRGDLYRDLLRDEEALDSYNRALALDSTNIFVLLNKGYLLERLERPSEACETYKLALSVDPTNVTVVLLLGRAHYSLRQYKLALDAYGRAIALDATSALAYYGRGQVLECLEEISPKEIRQAYMMARVFGYISNVSEETPGTPPEYALPLQEDAPPWSPGYALPLQEDTPRWSPRYEPLPQEDTPRWSPRYEPPPPRW